MLQEIWNGISPYILQIIGVILTTIASYIGLQIKKLYEKKVNTDIKEEIVKTVVNMVEQLAKSKGWTSEEKYNKARDTTIQLLNKAGIKITDMELEVLIESVVNSFTHSIKRINFQN